MHNKMMRKAKMKSTTFYVIWAVFLACYLAKTVECRRKTLRTDVRKEADSIKPVGVYEGEILFGKSLKARGTQPSSNASVEDETGYQSDVPGFPYDQTYMDAWNQMTKSLQCGADQMDFRVVGSGNQHFAVNQLNGPPLPLPLVPPSCGYNMRRHPFFLRLSIPYSGCNMIKEGGQYTLPLTWRGIPVVLSCQGPPTQIPNPWYPIPQIPPYPWHPLPPLKGQFPTNPQVPVPWPMDPWPIGPQPDIKPWHPWIDHSTVQPTPMPFPYPFPWYHDNPHDHKPPYYNYPFFHKQTHYHPYWPHVQVPTSDSPTMMPYDPVHYPPYVPGQRKVYADSKS